jgi:dihydroorotase
LAPNSETVELVRESWTVPTSLPFGDETIVPLRAGQEVRWRVVVQAA